LSMQLLSKISNLCVHNPPTSQTDRQTDDMRSQYRAIVHRAVKVWVLGYMLSARMDPYLEWDTELLGEGRGSSEFPSHQLRTMGSAASQSAEKS